MMSIQITVICDKCEQGYNMDLKPHSHGFMHIIGGNGLVKVTNEDDGEEKYLCASCLKDHGISKEAAKKKGDKDFFRK